MTAYGFSVTDDVQLVRDAIVAILDKDSAITSLTGRQDTNIIPFDNSGDADRPSVAFIVLTAPRIGGCGKRYRITVQFSARADSEALANELLGIVENKLTPMAFLGLASPIDAYQSTPPMRRGSDEDGRTDTEIVLDATFPLS